MDEATDLGPLATKTTKEYRTQHRKEHNEFTSNIRPEALLNVMDDIISPRSVDMKAFAGTEQELARDIEYLYANDGRAFNPNISYPLGVIDIFGKDYVLNARGIYYNDEYSDGLVTANRKVWIPKLESDWDEVNEGDRRKRALVLMKHNKNNEARHKSEYAWEADAWVDVFSGMRNDPCLELDKHLYYTELRKAHPVQCKLTAESTVVKRIPDLTFGLATFSNRTSETSTVWAEELSREPLEKLLLHRKCGLLSDPKWGETDLVFPFAVYEAKGWSGDCRQARRQACEAAARYLDMLDNLVRQPGPVGSTKIYQTKASHQYQVFALTSFGAHWHLLVGYRRPREVEEHAGAEGLSDTVYIFQRVWSGRVVDERSAWELLSLVDQIHLWAITEFRSFVVEHLRPWHRFCEENYTLDWKSVYDKPPALKLTRAYSEDEDLLLPKWVDLLDLSFQKKIQTRAKDSLAKALSEQRLRKGKGNCEDNPGIECKTDQCSADQETTYSIAGFLEHVQKFHRCEQVEVDKMARCLRAVFIDEGGKAEMELRARMNGGSARSSSSKRHLNEDTSNDDFSSSFLESQPGPSKRARGI